MAKERAASVRPIGPGRRRKEVVSRSQEWGRRSIDKLPEGTELHLSSTRLG